MFGENGKLIEPLFTDKKDFYQKHTIFKRFFQSKLALGYTEGSYLVK